MHSGTLSEYDVENTHPKAQTQKTVWLLYIKIHYLLISPETLWSASFQPTHLVKSLFERHFYCSSMHDLENNIVSLYVEGTNKKQY